MSVTLFDFFVNSQLNSKFRLIEISKLLQKFLRIGAVAEQNKRDSVWSEAKAGAAESLSRQFCKAKLGKVAEPPTGTP